MRHVCWAALGVVLLVSAYLALTAWFAYLTICLAQEFFSALAFSLPHRGGLMLALFLASVLALLLISSLFSVARKPVKDGLELTVQQEPELFAFLHALADAAGAPRPERVLLSARVNAAVVYNLSLFSLFVPARKQLELGLGLVTALNRSELAAVIGHEFGHFAQRSTAVGRWLYLARQVVERVLWQRSKLEQVLIYVSSNQPLTWVAWLPRLLIWSVRKLLAATFGHVERLERALGRELEFQADLVAAALTGSDALVHALHRSGPADEAWTFATEVALQELSWGHRVPDLFALQDRVIERMREILNDPGYGASPELPVEGRAAHRVFPTSLVNAPNLWASHPTNRDREDNVKRRYVAAELDPRPAVGLFRHADGLRRCVTERFLQSALRGARGVFLSDDAALAALNARLDRACFAANHRGTYVARSPVLHARSVQELYDRLPTRREIRQQLAALYPESLVAALRDLRAKTTERDNLRKLLTQVQGRRLDRTELRQLLTDAERATSELAELVQEHDRACRTVHQAIAREQGGGWEEYLENTALVLWYAAHTRRALEQQWSLVERALPAHAASGWLVDQFAAIDIERASESVRTLLSGIFEQRSKVKLTRELRNRLLGPGSSAEMAWQAMLPEAPPQARGDVKEFSAWFESLARSVAITRSACFALEEAALDLLLETEARLRGAHEKKTLLMPAPTLTGLPPSFELSRPDGMETEDIRWWGRPFLSSARPFRLLRLAIATVVFCALAAFTAAPNEVLDLRDQFAPWTNAITNP